VTFGELLSEKVTRAEIAVSLLAVLELIKRREVTAVQEAMFGKIAIVAAAPVESDEQALVVDELLEFDDF
jgi:chromatin segregation and condensation protein Rec8/ScpA/Scc1 (kleisin family)